MRQLIAFAFLISTLFAQNVVLSNGSLKSNGTVASTGSFLYGPASAVTPDDSGYTTLPNTCNQTLTAGGSYRLTQDLVCSSGLVTLTLGGLNTKLSLHGFIVTGRIISIGNPNGNEVFNGTVNCNYPDGSSYGCIYFDNAGTGTLTNTIKLHDITVNNDCATCSTTKRSIFFNLTGTTANSPDVEIYNVNAIANSAGNKDSNRIIALEVNFGGSGEVWIHNSIAFCGANEGACQGLIIYGASIGKQWNNYVTTNQLNCPSGICGDDPRMLGCDNTDLCRVYNNIANGVFGRVVRFRGCRDCKAYDNSVLNSGKGASGTGWFHIGDNDDVSAGGITASKTGTTVTLTNVNFIPYKSSWRVEVTGCTDTNANTINAVITKTGSTVFTYTVAIGGNSTPTGCAVNVAESNCNNEIFNNTLSIDTDQTNVVFARGIDCGNVHDNNIKTTLVNALTTGNNTLGYLRLNAPVTLVNFTRNYGTTSIQSDGSNGACGATHGQICLEANATISTTVCKSGTAGGGGSITTSTGC